MSIPRSELMPAADRASILNSLRVWRDAHVYVLGQQDLQVNVYSQQVRAINLAHALAPELTDAARIAVVGGGAAGLTAAATAAWLGFRKVTLYERAPQVLAVFRDNTKRYLHPHMYDWPYEGWHRGQAGLPILDWSAGTPARVAEALEQSWFQLRDVFGIEQPRDIKSHVVGIDRPVKTTSGSIRLRFSRAKPRSFDAVILAVGFGAEKGLRGRPGYWENDNLERTLEDYKNPSYLVVGCGDGGLIDYLRTRLQGFDQGGLISRLLPDGCREVEAAKRDLLQIEIDLWRSRPDGTLDDATEDWLLDRYMQIRADGIMERIEQSTRRTVKTVLAAPGRTPLRPGAFILNRFVALQLLRVDGLKLDRRGRPRSGGPFMGNFKIQPGLAKHYTKVIIRCGPRSALSRFHNVASALQRRARPINRRDDPTRLPGWKKGGDWAEASRRSALIDAVCGAKDNFGLLAALLQYCRNHRGLPDEADTVSWNKEFLASEKDLARAFKGWGERPTPAELRGLASALSGHWARFGWAHATASLAVTALQDARAGWFLFDFAKRVRAREDGLEVAPGSLVPTLLQTSANNITHQAYAPSDTVPRMPYIGWLPEHGDYKVRYFWHGDLARISSVGEVAVLLPNADRGYLLPPGCNAAGWTLEVAQPETQLATIMSVLEADTSSSLGNPIRAMVMPEFSTSPQVVEGLRTWIRKKGDTPGFVVVAGSYHALAAECPCNHESVILIAARSTHGEVTVRKVSRCFLAGDQNEGIGTSPFQITVIMSYESTVACVICADFGQPPIQAVLPELRPTLILVPACNSSRLDNTAFQLSRSLGTIVVIAYAPPETAPVDEKMPRRAAYIVGPADREGRTPEPVERFLPYPVAAPRLFVPSLNGPHDP